jgi:hypothetical protein
MIKKDNFGTRSNSKLAASGPIKAGTTNTNLGGKSVVARSNTPAQDPNLGRLVLTTIIQDIPKYSINGEGTQVAINYTSLQIPKEKELRHPLVAGIQVSLVSGNFSQLITITSTLALNDTTISVASFNPNVDIGKGALICIDEEDLFNQYQNKTKGTIAGFTVDSDGIAKSGIEITDWLNSDTMAGASVNNVPTALSVKNYVDNSHPAEDQTLQEVTDNGNTTTNSVMIGSSSSPTLNLEVIGGYDATPVKFLRHATYGNIIRLGRNGVSETANIGYPADATLNFSTASSERMRITSAGNVGIGTSSPSHKLQVVSSDNIGTTKIISAYSLSESQSTSLGYNSLMGSFSLAIKTLSTQPIKFLTNSAEKMRITSAGNVGIGTTSPTRPLHVVNTSSQTVAIFDGGNNDAGEIAFTGAGTSGGTYVTVGAVGNDMSLSAGAVERMRITSAGNVGIGTSLPTEKLHVVGDSYVTGDSHADTFKPDGTGEPIKFKNFASTELMRITSAGNVGIGTTSPSAKFHINVDSEDNQPALLIEKVSDNNETALVVKHISSSNIRGIADFQNTSGSVMKILADGNVGIGTTSPSVNLQVYDALSSQIKITNGLSTPVDLQLFASSSSYAGIGTSTNHRLALRTNNSEKLTILGDGNVGIGTSSPASLLHVEGAVQIGVNDAGHDFTLYGDTANYNMMWDASSSRLEFNDNTKAMFGNGVDLQIYHTGSHGNIKHDGTGDLIITQATANQDIIFKSDDGSGGETAYLTLDGSEGHTVASKEINFADGVPATFGNLAGGDLEIKEQSGNSYILNHTGNLTITNHADDKDIIFQSDDGSGGTTAYLTLDGSGGVINLGKHIKFIGGYLIDSAHSLRLDSAANQPVIISSNDSEKMRITSAGNLLIGTTTDSGFKLNVNGTIITNGYYGSNNINTFFANVQELKNVSGQIQYRAQNTLHYWNISNSEAMRISSNSNLLIGTTTDSGAKLQVAGSLTGTTATFSASVIANGNSNSFGNTTTAALNSTTGTFSSSVIASGNSNSFGNTSVGTLTGTTATFSGNVGITGTGNLTIRNTTGSGSGIVFMDNIWQAGIEHNSGKINFRTGGQNDRMQIDSGGNVLIGTTTNLGEKLQVAGTGKFTGQVTIPATPVATTDAASKSYVDSQVAEAGTSSFGSFTPTSTQSIASGGNVGVKSTLLLATSQVTASNITTSSAGLTFANAGLYQISFNFASKVSETANRTLAAANLEYSTDGETWTEIVGSLVYNYDRGTATSGGASAWGFVYDGSASCSFIHNLATSSIIRARFWIEGRASSASGITTIINGCRLSAHKIG